MTGVNDAPVAVAQTGATTEDAILNGSDLLAGATDVDDGAVLGTVSESLTSSLGASVTINANGTYTYNPTGSAVLQTIAEGDSADDTFTYRVVDEHGATDTATVTITVSGQKRCSGRQQ